MKKKIWGIFLSVFAMVLLVACGGRDLTNVRTSLYGHWVSDDDTHYYFNDSGMTTVSADGEQIEYSYKVLEHDEVKDMLELELTNAEEGGGHVTRYYYSNEDRNQIEAVTPLNSRFGAELTEEEKNDELTVHIRNMLEEEIARNDREITHQLEYVDDVEEPEESSN